MADNAMDTDVPPSPISLAGTPPPEKFVRITAPIQTPVPEGTDVAFAASLYNQIFTRYNQDGSVKKLKVKADLPRDPLEEVPPYPHLLC